MDPAGCDSSNRGQGVGQGGGGLRGIDSDVEILTFDDRLKVSGNGLHCF
jgi:hypothetical protein